MMMTHGSDGAPAGLTRASWRHAMLIAAILLVPVAAAQPEFCLRDADHDGHPMFGNPQVRTGFETYNGQTYVARAFAVAFGDLDGDGDPDALVVNNKESASAPLFYLTVHLNHADGVFDPADVPYPVGAGGVDVAVGDLDGDGDLDAATANAFAGTVSILLNRGDATFAPHAEYPVGQRPRSLRMADLGGDGDLDLIALNVTSNDVSVLHNKGDGTFAPEVRVFVGSVTTDDGLPGPFPAVGDLDGDGDADVAVPCFAKVKLLLNDGAGALSLAPVHPSVATPNAHAVTIADLDGDADNDLAVSSVYVSATYNPYVLSVMLNTGGGAFAAPVAYNAGTTGFPQYACSITAGDIDADLDIDLVVGHELGSKVMLMRNLGDGAFAPKEEVRVFDRPWFVRFAELNGDNRLDLAVLTVWSRSKLCVLLNNGAGSVVTDARYPPTGGASGQGWNWLETADLDTDGDLDLVVTARGTMAPFDVLTFRNDGSGAFSTTWFTRLSQAEPCTCESLSIGDLDGDGIPDLVVCDAVVPGGFDQSGKVWTMIGNGDGAFQPGVPYALTGLTPKHVAIADFDGDHDNDLAVWTVELYPGNDLTPVARRLVLMRNTGLGTFQVGDEHVIGMYPWPFPLGSVAAGDWDDDGDTDIAGTAATNSPAGVVVVFRNQGAGAFLAAQVEPVASAPWSVLPVDIDGDSDLDLGVLVASGLQPDKIYLQVLGNDGAGIFALRETYKHPLAISGPKLAAGHDGRAGLVLAFPNDVLAMVHRLRPDGVLLPHQNYGTGYWPTAVVLGDFNGDDRLDLAATNSSDSNVSVLLNRACDGCYPDCDADGVLAAADFFCFQSKFSRLDPYADCNQDAALNVRDFGCFQTRFVQGCP